MSDCMDHYYHPSTEEELIALVQRAHSEGRELRVRGAAHSVSHAIYTDPLDLPNEVNQQCPPVSDNINVMLDQYRKFWVVDPGRKLVECQAGIHLGKDPWDPDPEAGKLENSLLYQLQNDYGWMINDTGGVTFQTISGFTATGSSGGSLQYSVNANLYGFRIIDGTGNVYGANRDDNPELFWALAPNMGLLGVVSTITLQCEDTFNISGQEAITTLPDCAMDLFGTNPGKPSVETFLKEVEYTRFEWYPQTDSPGSETQDGGGIMIVWQAQRMKPQLGFIPTPYEEFTTDVQLDQVGISILFTIIGNLDDLSRAKQLLEPTWEQMESDLENWLETQLPLILDILQIPELVAALAKDAVKAGVDVFIDLLMPFAGFIQEHLPYIYTKLLVKFEPLDSTKPGYSKGNPQAFRDYAWHGLPMDDQMSNILLPVAFTEIWLPVQHATRVMNLLNDFFNAAPNPQERLQRTGTFAIEFYAAMPTQFWMSMSYTDGNDEWKDGVFRIDPYWFVNNPGNPAEVFYPQFWNLLRENNIPFRLHWGKFQPVYDQSDPEGWVDFFKSQYSKWNDFLALRQEKDPNNIFLNDYWRSRFGLWDLPRPQPIAP